MQLTFITSHAKKAEEISWHLGHLVDHRKLDLPEIQSLDPHEVVRVKAQEAYRLLQRPVLVEDFSLSFEALGKLPGPLIKWFLQELNVDGICKLLDSYSSRVAYSQTCFGYCDEDGVQVFDGLIEGAIANDPRGDNSYGTDTIFIPKGQNKTWGEMNKEEQVTYSVRRIGLKKLEKFLASRGSNHNNGGRKSKRVPKNRF
jgi:non-canonical purine NTP pyrophosphatase (RdgB/HAM1 family)